MALRDIFVKPIYLIKDQLIEFANTVEAMIAAAGSALDVQGMDEVSIGTADGIRVPDIVLDGTVAVFPYIPLQRTDAELSSMSPPISFVLYANTTTGKLQYFDGTNWIVLGSGGGVIGIPPGANVSWESDTNVTGSPVSSWVSKDNTVTLTQSGTSRPSIAAGAFGSTQGLLFDGINDFMAVASKIISVTGAGSISLVFKTGTSVVGPMVLVSQSDAAVANDWFEVGINADGKFYVESNNAGTKMTVLGSSVLLASTVYNVILCYDGTDFFILLNNVEENPLEISNIGTFAWFGRIGGTTTFTVGATTTSGGTFRNFSGIIGGIYFWDTDLTI